MLLLSLACPQKSPLHSRWRVLVAASHFLFFFEVIAIFWRVRVFLCRWPEFGSLLPSEFGCDLGFILRSLHQALVDWRSCGRWLRLAHAHLFVLSLLKLVFKLAQSREDLLILASCLLLGLIFSCRNFHWLKQHASVFLQLISKQLIRSCIVHWSRDTAQFDLSLEVAPPGSQSGFDCVLAHRFNQSFDQIV